MEAKTKSADVRRTRGGWRACIELNGELFWAPESRHRRHEAEHDLAQLKQVLNYAAIEVNPNPAAQ